MTEKLKKLKRTTDDILIMITDEEEMFRKKFITQKYDSDEWKCTVCSKITKDKPYPHPALRVSICFDCLKSYQNTAFRVNKYETDKNCRWCAKESKKFECSQCTVVFCKNCLERNFGADFVRNTVTKDWNCFICFPKPLWRLRVACYKAMQDINQISGNSEEIVIDLLSQESQENRLPCSEQALPDSGNPFEQLFESPIISPKKPPQPIVESECESDDEKNSLWLTQASNNQQEATNNNNEEMSAEEKKILSEVFKETEKDLHTFIDLFNKRVSQLSQKFICENISSCVQAEKLVNRFSDFCDKAVENIHYVKKNCHSRFQNWSGCVNSVQNSGNSSIQNEQSETNCDTNEPKDKLELTPNKDVSLKTVQIKSSVSLLSSNDELEKDSDALLENKKIRSKTKKYSLSLKLHSKEPKNDGDSEDKNNSKDVTPEKKFPTSLTPLKNENSATKSTPNTSKEKKDIKSSPKKEPAVKDKKQRTTTQSNQTLTKKSPNKNEDTSPSKSEDTFPNKSEDTSSKVPPKKVSNEFSSVIPSNETSTANLSDLSKTNISQTSLEIKTEETSEDTIIRATTAPSDVILENNNGEEELMVRILEDFEENSTNLVTIENYLCDKTGEFCQSYQTGHDSIEDSPINSIKEEGNFGDNDSDKTEDFDWNSDFGDLNIIEELSNVKNTKENSLQEEIVIKEEPSDIDDEEISVKTEQLSQESDDLTILTKNKDQDTIIREETTEVVEIIEDDEEISVKEEQLSQDSNILTKNKGQDTIIRKESIEVVEILEDDEEISVKEEQLSQESQVIVHSTQNQQTIEKESIITEEEEENSVKEEQLSEESQKTVKLQKINQTSEDSSEETIKLESEAESIHSDSESARDAAFRALRSDTSHLSSSSDFTFSDNDSDGSFYRELQRKEQEQPGFISVSESGYVRQLDIAEELAKLRRNNQETNKEKDSSDSENESEHSKNIQENSDSSACEEENSEIEDSCYISDHNIDLKLTTLKPVVRLEQFDYEKYLEDRIIKSSSDESENETEINRLINMKSLKKRNRILSSDSSSGISESRKKRLTKKRRKSSKDSKSGSDSDESFRSLNSDSSFNSLKSEPNSNDLLQRKDKDYMPTVDEDILNDSLSACSVSDDDVIEIKDTTKKKDKDVLSLLTDEEEGEKSSKEVDEQSKWRKDSLLTGNLNMRSRNSDSETTNDSTANDLLRKEEERYLKNIDKKKKSRRKSVESISSSGNDEDDAIILSDGGTEIESDNSDCQIISLKRKHESDDESIAGKSKKGRRNIKKVLKDSELQAETQKADKEESQRKERLSLKQKAMDSVLSESQLSQEEAGLVLDVDEDKKKPILTVHHTLVPKLKEHQKKGIKFMWDVCFESVSELKRNKGTGCILAHCMGLGKTMQVVVLAHTLLTNPETEVKHILIVCPLSTVFNWRDEFDKTLRVCSEKILIYDIRPDKQSTFYSRMCVVKMWKQNGGVLMLGYESFQSLVSEKNLLKTTEECKNLVLESLVDPGPGLVVCDEGHMLKNGKTIRFTTLTKIQTKRRIILTGTPLQNNLVEYYHMVNFVKPHLLGTLEEYKNRFVNPISNGQYEDSSTADINLMKKRSHVLHKKLETTVQRYEESELIPYLPPKQDYVLYVQLTPLQIILYEHYLQLLDLNTKKLFKNYHALQNIWTHPALLKIKFDKRKEPTPKAKKTYDEYFVRALDPDSEDPTGLETDWFKDLLPEDILTNVSYGVKMELLFSIIKECELIKDKLLVFSSSIDELDLIETFLKNRSGESWKKGLDYYRMDGTVAPEKRMQYCNSFNDEANQRSRLFLVSHKVGGLGLNLTAANRVVLMDVSWNPAYDTQSMFRVYRFGQTKTCYIYRFVSMGTMEEVVYSRAVTKLAISCRVVDEHQIKRHFNSDDLQRMYRLIKDFADPPTPTLPSDRLLAKLWETHKPLLYKFCDHQSLLENLAHEELNEEEMKLAWEEFGKEIEAEKHAKETINNRFNNFPPAQIHPSLLPYQQQQQKQYHALGAKIAVQSPEDLLPNSLQRFKRPNRLPTANELIQNANNFATTNEMIQNVNRFPTVNDFNYQKFNRLPTAERKAFYEKFGVDTKLAFNTLMSSNSTNSIPSTSKNNPSTSTSFPAASTSSNFPSTSSSTNPNFAAPSTSTSAANVALQQNFPRIYNNLLNLSANENQNSGIRSNFTPNNGVRNPNPTFRPPNSGIRPNLPQNNGVRNPNLTFRPSNSGIRPNLAQNNGIRNPNSTFRPRNSGIRPNSAPNIGIRNPNHSFRPPNSAVRPNLPSNNGIRNPNNVIRNQNPTFRPPNSGIRPNVTPNNGIRNPNSAIRTYLAPNNRIRNPFSAVRPNLVPNNRILNQNSVILPNPAAGNRIQSPNSVIRPNSPTNGNETVNSTNSVIIEVPNSRLYKNGMEGKTKIRVIGNNSCDNVSTGGLSKSDGQKENIVQDQNTNGVPVLSETKTNATPNLTPLGQNHPTK